MRYEFSSICAQKKNFFFLCSYAQICEIIPIVKGLKQMDITFMKLEIKINLRK